MDNLVQTIEKATAKVDGTSENDVIIKPAAEEPTIEPTPDDENNHEKKNGNTPPKMVDVAPEDDNMKRRLSKDDLDGGSKRTKTEEVPDKPAEETKSEVSEASAPVTTPVELPVESVETLTTTADEPMVVETEKPDVVEEAFASDAVSSDLPDAEKVTIPDPEPVTIIADSEVTAPLEPTKDDSVINLDSTMESEAGDNANTEGNIADDDETLNQSDAAVVEDKSIVVPVAEEKEEILPEKTSEMEITLDTKEILETPNVSIGPLVADGHLLVSAVAPHLMLSNGSSTPNSNNATSVEFQATPIKKSIEESIEELHGEGKVSSAVDSYSQDTLSTTDDKSKSSSDDKTNEAMKRLQETIKQVNGITTTPESSLAASDAEDKSGLLHLLDTLSDPDDLTYETAVHVDNGTLQYLLIERVDHRPVVGLHAEVSDAVSEKSTSNGSASSLGPFALPGTVGRTASGLSVSSSSSVSIKNFIPPPENKKMIKGLGGLKTFLQDLLKQLPDEKKKPTGRGRGRAPAAAAPAATASKVSVADKRGSLEAPSSSKAAVETTPGKKQVAFAASTESRVENFVMARWSDKKYYAGRIKAEKPGNKYVVLFEDGAQRTLASEHIVFGDKFVAPLLNHQVNVLVEGNIYETGLVMAINPDACTYEVTTDTRSVTVPASDLYLEEDQAKEVQNAVAGKTPVAESSSASAKDCTPTASPMSRRKRNADTLNSSAEAGPSTVAETATKKSRKR